MKTNFLDELGVKASIIVMSHLSDVQTEINFITELDVEMGQKSANQNSMRLDFAKWLIIKLDGNLSQSINVQLAFDEFCEFRKIK